MKEIIVKNPRRSKSGKSVVFKHKNKNWVIKFEVLNKHNISKLEEVADAVILLDELEIVTKKNWHFIEENNILMIIKNEISDQEKEITKEIDEEIKLEVKNEDNNPSLTNEVFTSDNDEIEEKNKHLEIDFDKIYKNIEIYEKSNDTKKMTSIDKLIEKSIKLTPIKYNNGKVKKDDYTYDDLLKLAGNDLVPFLKGKTNELTIKYPKKIKIPREFKNNKLGTLNWLEERRYLSFAKKSSIENYKNNLLSNIDLLNEIDSKLSTKFAKIKNIARKSKKLKYETGFNPFVIAWPYLIGKTNNGTFIHAPICYQEIDIEASGKTGKSLESVFVLKKTGNFNINTYPILKNYTEEKYAVNEIQRFLPKLQDVLKEFYKHGLEIKKPTSNELTNYKRIFSQDEETKKYRNFYFQLSNEVLLKFKPNDELIHSDLRLIRKEYANFSIPESNTRLLDHNIDKKSNKKRHIFNLDDYKTFAVEKAMVDSMVIWGPPGTGKSQAISTIVGEFIRKNKTSLIVAEKAAAIDVIESNLKKIGLDSFVLNINNPSKMDFQKKFEKQMKILLSTPVEKKDYKLIYSEKWLNKYDALNIFYSKYSQEKLQEIYKLLADVLFIINFQKDLKTTEATISFYEALKANYELKKNQPVILKEIEEKTKRINYLKNEVVNLKTQTEDNQQTIIAKLEMDETVNKLGSNNLIDKELWIDKINEAETVNEVYNVIAYGSINTTKWNTPLKKWKINKYKIEIKKIYYLVKDFKKSHSEINDKIDNFNKENGELEAVILSLNEKLASINDNNVLIFNEITVRINDEKILKIKNLKNEIDEALNLKDLMLKKHWDWNEHKKEMDKHIKLVKEAIIYQAQVNFQNECNNTIFNNKIMRLEKLVSVNLGLRKNTIIKLVSEFSEYFKKIFASLMMAPEYVSYIFSHKKNQFDYAVFDEASQIRLHKALPAIHRSNKIIVSGDEKQLGPTDLFADISEEDEEAMTLEEREGEDLEERTLLNFAKKKYFSVPLITHYRSKSKELIEFSNDNFYKNAGIELDAVDSPLARFDGRNAIIVEEVKGEWKEKTEIVNEITLEKRTNIKEAKRVVELFEEYHNYDKSLSIGIITFNVPQRNLIDNLINRQFEENSEVNKMINDPSRFFIKAIKDVQGDERDIIIFSITYGLQEIKQKYVKQFGWFSKEKINVAITRACLRMHVLKSLPSYQVTANSEDYQIFKKWLTYLEPIAKKENNLMDKIEHKNELSSQFQQEFYEALAQSLINKYQLLVNYQVGNKEIDIAVWDKNQKSFVCAIELDGTKVYNSQDKLEDDYNRQILLENMGWQFIRLSPLKFYENPLQTIDWVISEIVQISDKNKLTLTKNEIPLRQEDAHYVH